MDEAKRQQYAAGAAALFATNPHLAASVGPQQQLMLSLGSFPRDGEFKQSAGPLALGMSSTLETGDASTKVPPPPPKQTLPTGWKETKDGDGDTYYFNQGTGATQWDHPNPIKRQRVEIQRPPPKPPPKPATMALPLAEVLPSHAPNMAAGATLLPNMGAGATLLPSTSILPLHNQVNYPPEMNGSSCPTLTMSPFTTRTWKTRIYIFLF